MATADRLRGYLTTLADTGQLTPDRLADEAAAILGLSDWAAEHQQWSRVLEIVKTLQACFGIARRIEEWLALLHQGRSAAQALGDRNSEVWILRQLATASLTAGDRAAADRYLREAGDPQPQHVAPPSRQSQPTQPQSQPAPPADTPSTPPAFAKAATAAQHPALWVGIGVVAIVLGLGGGYALGKNSTQSQQITKEVPFKVRVHGKVTTLFSTVTGPASTVTSTTTTTTTVTVPAVVS